MMLIDGETMIVFFFVFIVHFLKIIILLFNVSAQCFWLLDAVLAVTCEHAPLHIVLPR